MDTVAGSEVGERDIHPQLLTQGKKYDAGKAPWDLVPWEAVEQIVQVLEYGRQKYGPWNWQLVPGHRRRYFAALLRHLMAWRKGETLDPETGLPHLAHAGCCLLFLMSKEIPGALESFE